MWLFGKKKTEIKMVQDENLVPYLKSIGLYEKIISKKIKCKFCGKTITVDNLQALVPNGKQICVVCSNIKCLNQL